MNKLRKASPDVTAATIEPIKTDADSFAKAMEECRQKARAYVRRNLVLEYLIGTDEYDVMRQVDERCKGGDWFAVGKALEVHGRHIQAVFQI
jgi:hypothetical protein